jgi:hypothetical protein
MEFLFFFEAFAFLDTVNEIQFLPKKISKNFFCSFGSEDLSRMDVQVTTNQPEMLADGNTR